MRSTLTAMRGSLEAFLSGMQAPQQAAPALVLGLSMLLVVPVLAIVGALMRAVLAASRTPENIPRQRHCPAWPREAWLEVSGGGNQLRVEIGDGLVRIGRERDNEVRIRDETVHRYHAAIHRADDAYVLVTDLSNGTGNGVVVNGRRIGSKRLKDGDTIALGRAQVVFHSAPLAAREIAQTAAQ